MAAKPTGSLLDKHVKDSIVDEAIQNFFRLAKGRIIKDDASKSEAPKDELVQEKMDISVEDTSTKRQLDFSMTNEEYSKLSKEKKGRRPKKTHNSQPVAASKILVPSGASETHNDTEIGTNHTEDSEFQIPKHTARPHTPTPQTTEISNKYEALHTALPEDGEIEEVQAQKPPPILLSAEQDVVEILKQLNDTLEVEILGKKAGRYFKIQSTDLDQYSRINILLQSMGVQYFTHGLAPKTFKVVIKGFTLSTKTSCIQQALREQKYAVEKVSRMVSARTKEEIPFVEVEIRKSPGVPNIYQLDRLLYTRVTVEKLRSRKRLVYCFHCQGANHIAKFCNMKPKCARCGQEHNSRDCQREKEDKKLTCAACGGEHYISSKDCPKRKKIPQRAIQTVPHTNTISYANALKANLHRKNSTKVINSNNFKNIDREVNTNTKTDCLTDLLDQIDTETKNMLIVSICTNIFNVVNDSSSDNKSLLFNQLLKAVFH